GNDIVLAKGNVSKYHSRLVEKDGRFILVDMKSTNGTYVNGKKIAAPQVIKPDDKIYIGDYIINVRGRDGDSGADEHPSGESMGEDEDDNVGTSNGVAQPDEDEDEGSLSQSSSEPSDPSESSDSDRRPPLDTRQRSKIEGVSKAKMPASLAAAM